MGAPVGWGPVQPPRAARLGAQHPPGPRRMLPGGSCSRLSAATVQRSHFELAAAVRRKGYGPNPSFRCPPAGLLGINKSKAGGIWNGIDEATHQRGTAKRGSAAGGRGGRRGLTCSSHIREGLKSRWQPGYPGDPSLGASLAAAGGWRAALPAARSRLPCPGAGGHMPTCCRSRPEITAAAAPKASPPMRAAGKASGRLGSSSALQLDVCEGGFKQPPRHGGQQRAGGGVALGAEGCLSPCASPWMGMSGHHQQTPTLASAAPAPGGPVGLAEAPCARPSCAHTHAACPATALPWAGEGGWRGGGFASTRPPTC